MAAQGGHEAPWPITRVPRPEWGWSAARREVTRPQRANTSFPLGRLFPPEVCNKDGSRVHQPTPRSGLAAYQEWTREALCKARYMCNIGHT